MLTAPLILRTPYQRAAVIRLIVPRSEMPVHIPLALAELLATLADQRLAATGPLFAHYLRITRTHFDLELGLPVSFPIRPSGRVDPGQLPDTTVARAIHHGPLTHLSDAWADLDRWIASRPHRPATDLWERYITDPTTVTDPSQYQTELNRPLRPETHATDHRGSRIP